MSQECIFGAFCPHHRKVLPTAPIKPLPSSPLNPSHHPLYHQKPLFVIRSAVASNYHENVIKW